MKWIKLSLRILISAFFVFSAVSKLMAMDAFEVYLYRISFLGFDMAAILGRVVTGIELLIAIGFLVKLKFRFFWWFATIFVLILSTFLIFQMIGGSKENCFCLGELIEFSPAESLLKNGILLLFLLLVKSENPFHFRLENLTFSLAVVIAMAIPILVSPPDIMLEGRFNAAEHDQQALDEALESGSIPSSFVEGRKVLAFYSTGCQYCQMSSERIGASIRKYNIDTILVNNVFWGDSTVQAPLFYEDTHSPHFNYVWLPTKAYLDITKGRMPLLLLIDDGKVKQQMNYRTLDEAVIRDFLKE